MKIRNSTALFSISLGSYALVAEYSFLNIILQYFFPFKVHNLSFIQSFDLFFKMHLVLHQNFEPSIENMMLFIQYAVFKFPEKDLKPTGHMKTVANMLQ